MQRYERKSGRLGGGPRMGWRECDRETMRLKQDKTHHYHHCYHYHHFLALNVMKENCDVDYSQENIIKIEKQKKCWSLLLFLASSTSVILFFHYFFCVSSLQRFSYKRYPWLPHQLDKLRLGVIIFVPITRAGKWR